MDDLYRQALTQEALVPVGPPEVEVTEPDPIAFSVVVSVYPTVDPATTPPSGSTRATPRSRSRRSPR
jgi:FKBP-type peptidyl-prolyl cis-trans isomerase (trigger factor)